MVRFLGILLITMLFLGCSSEKRRLLGVYESSAQIAVNDDINSIVDIKTREDFGWFGLKCESEIKISFLFNESFDFRDIILNYKLDIEGDWHFDDGILTVSLDSTSFKYDFVGSNAERPTEKTMVRSLREEVRNTLLPDLRRRILNMTNRNIEVPSVSDSVLIVAYRDDGKEMILRKIE
ncbi:MAG: hypothetical protein J6Y82_08185 [Bacteroidales bacterium]|nr:hypothetical protein [Bacteroidales bacterium]